ncbi:MAG TPA: hypothetical protein VME86_04635 [Acidobacteriaceae bacterium]|nr:hypothetical protein [Acidobacteriaceae bacterium]
MRRQNPPQACIDRARKIEKYLSPSSIATIYGIAAIAYAVVVTLIFGLLVAARMVTATQTTVMVFALAGLIPVVFLILAVFLRPNDPVSLYIKSCADTCRRPLPVSPDDCTFKVHLMDGELLCVKLSFFYPSQDRSADLKERIYTVVHGALSQDFSTRVIIPAYQEVEAALNKPLAILAEERGIPVLYSEIREVFNAREEVPAQVTYINTGTWS